jgi:hypothetical protein
MRNRLMSTDVVFATGQASQVIVVMRYVSGSYC